MTYPIRHLALVLTLLFLTGCSSLFPKPIPNPSLILPPNPPQIDQTLKETPAKLEDPTDSEESLAEAALETLAGANLTTAEGREKAKFTVRKLAAEHINVVILYRILRDKHEKLVSATDKQEQWYLDLMVILEEYEDEVNDIK